MDWISFDDHTGVFTLRTRHSMYQMQVREYGFLTHLYYGKDLGDTQATYRVVTLDRGFSPNPAEAGNRVFSLDTLPLEYAGCGIGDYRTPALEVVLDKDGSSVADLRYKGWKSYPGKYTLTGLPATFGSEEEVQTLELIMKDEVTGLKATLLYGVFYERDIITRAVRLEKEKAEGSGDSITLHKVMSMQMDYLPRSLDLIHFHGRHTMERVPKRISLSHGIQSVGSTRGSSSHQHNPFVILCNHESTENSGSCWGFSFVYSGNFLCETEIDQLNQTRICMGIHSQQFRWTLKEGECFEAPEVIMAYSGEGFSTLSKRLHDAIRNHLIRSPWVNKPRPLLVNNWEATYFGFNEEKLLQIAQNARELGLDLFVLDDGWFGKRDSDTTGLGDWKVNETKLKGGMEKLAQDIHGMGMKLGIWIEPEMISEDSDLYRAHPDWCLRVPGRAPWRGRDQLNLDITRPEVRAEVMDQICGLIRKCGIEYVKWDFNRNLGNVYSLTLEPERQGEVFHRYMLALYEMQERLVTEFPDLLLENCAGGGGRFDCGMLYYSPQIWCSDNTDAIDRMMIHYGTSFGYPMSTIGAHVSTVPNHQTGRQVSFATRGLVASNGTFGFELDLSRLSDEEKQAAKDQIRYYREKESLVQRGDYYRLTSPLTNHEHIIWQYVSKDQRETVTEGVILRSRSNTPVSYVRLKGLKEKSHYKDRKSGKVYTGAALMYAGLPLPVTAGDYQPVRLWLDEI